MTCDALRRVGQASAAECHGLLRGGQLLAHGATATIGASHVKALAHRTKEAGGDLLDAPVSGSQVSLAQGKLLIMVGGDPDVLERALALGREVGVPLPTTDTTNTWLTAAHGQGLSHHDFSIL